MYAPGDEAQTQQLPKPPDLFLFSCSSAHCTFIKIWSIQLKRLPAPSSSASTQHSCFPLKEISFSRLSPPNRIWTCETCLLLSIDGNCENVCCFWSKKRPPKGYELFNITFKQKERCLYKLLLELETDPSSDADWGCRLFFHITTGFIKPTYTGDALFTPQCLSVRLWKTAFCPEMTCCGWQTIF